MRADFTDAEKAEIKRLHDAGWLLKDIAIRFECHRDTIKRVVDPEYHLRRNATKRVEAARKREAFKRDFPLGAHPEPDEPRPHRADIAARLAEIPDDDNRSLTAMLCGDPNPADRRRHWRAA